MLWMRCSLNNVLHHLNKWRDDPEITIKLLFCCIFGLKICRPNIRFCPFNNDNVCEYQRFKEFYIDKLAVCPSGIASFLGQTRIESFGSKTVNYIFLNIWNSFGLFVFYWMFYLLSLLYIDLMYMYVVIFMKDLKTRLMFN